MLHANFHTHTNLCDGSDSPQEVAKEAVRRGFLQLGFSGHMDADNVMDLPVYVREIRRLQEQYKGKMDILLGTELDTLYNRSKPGKSHPSPFGRQEDGTMLRPGGLRDGRTLRGADGEPEWDEAWGAIEYVIGSTHFIDVESEIPMAVDWEPERLAQLCDQYFGGDYYRLAREYYRTEQMVYEKTGCTFVGHFDLVTRFNDQMHFLDEADPRYLTPALETMEYLVLLGLPFEINCGAFNRGRKKELYPNMDLLRALHGFGGEIFINADAHQKELLTGGFETAIARARACGFTHVNILAHDETGHITIKQKALDGI